MRVCAFWLTATEAPRKTIHIIVNLDNSSAQKKLFPKRYLPTTWKKVIVVITTNNKVQKCSMKRVTFSIFPSNWNLSIYEPPKRALTFNIF
jgi:hypothetical protein